MYLRQAFISAGLSQRGVGGVAFLAIGESVRDKLKVQLVAMTRKSARPMTSNKSGIYKQHSNLDVRPQDDLFRHVNGKWLKEAQIPADRASDGEAYRLHDEAEQQVREIIESAAKESGDLGSLAQKIGDLYRSFMDEAGAEAKGVTPIEIDLARASSVETKEQFLTLLGELEIEGLGGLFYAFITSDNKKSDENILYVGQSGLSLPDEAYYREDEYVPIREAFISHVTRMCALAGIDGGSEHAVRILSVETELASHHWDQVKDRDATETYNKVTFSELQKLSDGFDWQAWNKGAQVPALVTEKVIVRQPSFFSGLGSMLNDFDGPRWRSWLMWQILSGGASYLNADIVNENFAFYGTTLSGVPQLRERWKRGVRLVEGALGEAVGQIYVEAHFPPAAKLAMEKLVDNLIEAYRVDITALEWMTSETKVKALEKLDKFTPKIGYPDKWRDYSALQISSDDLIANLAAVSRFSRDYEFAKIGKPVDKTEWLMTPQTVNAYYNPGMNEIVFPAAILQSPFFDLDADDAANYGGIGSVIGHEIGHGFDDQGSKFDGDGNLNDWWTQDDRVEFDKRSQKLIAQFDVLTPEETPDSHVNGALTIGENIGDLGGLTIAHKAYEISLGGQPAPVIDGDTGFQRFFLGYAQVWRGKVRPEEIVRRLATDPHSPDEFRCNQIVKNLEEFYQAFDVREGDALWLDPAERVRIW